MEMYRYQVDRGIERISKPPYCIYWVNEKKTSGKLLDAINKAYADSDTKEDGITRKKGLIPLAGHMLEQEKYQSQEYNRKVCIEEFTL